MNALKSASVIACVCCIACSIISLIAPLGRMKKTVNLILGLFMICSMIVPVVGLFSTEKPKVNIDDYAYESGNYEYDYEELVLNETADNLVRAANDLLLAENITVDNIEIGIKKSDNNSIYISRIIIYINKEFETKVDKIKNVISINMSKEPVVIVSEN